MGGLERGQTNPSARPVEGQEGLAHQLQLLEDPAPERLIRIKGQRLIELLGCGLPLPVTTPATTSTPR